MIKEVKYRVKGTERFWNDDPRGEAILPVRAALLSHDDRPARHLNGSPYARAHPPARTASQETRRLLAPFRFSACGPPAAYGSLTGWASARSQARR